MSHDEYAISNMLLHLVTIHIEIPCKHIVSSFVHNDRIVVTFYRCDYTIHYLSPQRNLYVLIFGQNIEYE